MSHRAKPSRFSDLRDEILRDGEAGVRPAYPITPDLLEQAAHGVLSERALAYIAGGASTERTMRANLEAFRRWRLVPRMLRGTIDCDLSVELFGQRLSAPVLTAPVGGLGLVHDEPESCVARAAGALGIGQVLSTVAHESMERVAAAGPDTVRWYQLYWPNDDEIAESMVRRAEANGYTAIVVTVDLPVFAWRPRDLTLASLPFTGGLGLGSYLADPVFRSRLAEPPESSEQAMQAAGTLWAQIFGRPGLTWHDLATLRQWTSLPIMTKGICHPDDALTAIDAGVDGVVVSNHGGRQVDGARAALDCLVDVAKAAGDRTTVLFDSGIRCGADVVIALALGAHAVLVGRPWVYGLALGGQDGVSHVLRYLLADTELTMVLSGHATPAGLSADAVVHDG